MCIRDRVGEDSRVVTLARAPKEENDDDKSDEAANDSEASQATEE